MRHFAPLAVVGAVLTLFACSSGARNANSMMPGGDVRHTAERQHKSLAYTVIHSFGGSEDGAEPYGGLVDVKGTFYGTTRGGGSKHAGTVFSITPAGTETVLHNFDGSDGAGPAASLIDMDGMLYGTTVFGGVHGEGTVFSITPSGKETVLHSFRGGMEDGGNPFAALVNLGGTLYGTTLRGGALFSYFFGYGTVFSITPSGAETVLHKFSGGSDGANPWAGLIKDDRGTLLGTASRGGAYDSGTVFAITPAGTLTVLHTFGYEEGAEPLAALIEGPFGDLYGTTSRGGSSYKGTVFVIAPSGAEAIHSFGSSGDGSVPRAELVEMGGTLYGTTKDGGANVSGTIFAITPSDTETVLHSFGGSGDGAIPYAGLINVGGTLYGTTTRGGAHDKGIVFSLTP